MSRVNDDVHRKSPQVTSSGDQYSRHRPKPRVRDCAIRTSSGAAADGQWSDLRCTNFLLPPRFDSRLLNLSGARHGMQSGLHTRQRFYWQNLLLGIAVYLPENRRSMRCNMPTSCICGLYAERIQSRVQILKPSAPHRSASNRGRSRVRRT